MSRPNLDTPEGRDAYRAELRTVAVPWRVAGIFLILIAAIALVIGSGAGKRPGDPLMLAAFGLLTLGWILAGVGIYLRRAYHRRRLRD
jgi:hypothetical protein